MMNISIGQNCLNKNQFEYIVPLSTPPHTHTHTNGVGTISNMAWSEFHNLIKLVRSMHLNSFTFSNHLNGIACLDCCCRCNSFSETDFFAGQFAVPSIPSLDTKICYLSVVSMQTVFRLRDFLCVWLRFALNECETFLNLIYLCWKLAIPIWLVVSNRLRGFHAERAYARPVIRSQYIPGKSDIEHLRNFNQNDHQACLMKQIY